MKSSNHSMLKLHQNLCKAESFFIMQICFDCINFIIFLNKINVFDYKLLMYQCDQTQEIITHIIIYCFRFAEIKHILKDSITNQLNIWVLINMSTSIQHLIKWFMKLQILLQFQLTEQLLYEKIKIDKLKKKQSNSKII